ncbi:MAG: zinc ribbon domain-containing protein [Thermoleophilaceae bacterium]
MRETLLLDFGALVYELHRRGERAPELLQEKAGELSEVDGQVREGGTGVTPCPSCGAEAEPGQLVCTNCGTRLALGRRPDRAIAALIALVAVVLVGGGAAGFALSELTSDAGEDGTTFADQPEQSATPPAAAAGEPQEATQADDPATGTPQEPRRSLLLDWPDDLTAHTVVLVTTSDRPAALRLARQAAKSGIEAGLLRSDDYNLGTGLWIVFAGRFDTPEGAARQSSDLAERFPGAYPQLVEPAG